MECNENKLLNPDWLNDNFFENILKKSECDSKLKITSLTVTPATNPGENFASVVFRVLIEFSSKSKENNKLSLIVKTELNDEEFRASSAVCFENEIRMYTITLPEIQRLINLSGDNILIAPRLYYQSKDPHFVIVIEDLSVTGYESINVPLEWDATKLIVQQLGKFHAASFYMESDKESVSTYKSGLFNEHNLNNLGFMLENVYILTDVMKTWHGCEKLVEKFEKLKEHFLQKGCDIYSPNDKENGFNVLNHGDFHLRNLLMKKQFGKSKQFMFIDFQMTFYGSPAIDIIYLLYAIASAETRENHRSDIIQLYYNTFVETLKNIGYIGKNIPTLLDLNIEIAQKGFLEVIIAVCFLPIMFYDFTKIKPETVFDQNSEVLLMNKQKVFEIPAFKAIVLELLQRYMHKGFLD